MQRSAKSVNTSTSFLSLTYASSPRQSQYPRKAQPYLGHMSAGDANVEAGDVPVASSVLLYVVAPVKCVVEPEVEPTHSSLKRGRPQEDPSRVPKRRIVTIYITDFPVRVDACSTPSRVARPAETSVSGL